MHTRSPLFIHRPVHEESLNAIDALQENVSEIVPTYTPLQDLHLTLLSRKSVSFTQSCLILKKLPVSTVDNTIVKPEQLRIIRPQNAYIGQARLVMDVQPSQSLEDEIALLRKRAQKHVGRTVLYNRLHISLGTMDIGYSTDDIIMNAERSMPDSIKISPMMANDAFVTSSALKQNNTAVQADRLATVEATVTHHDPARGIPSILLSTMAAGKTSSHL